MGRLPDSFGGRPITYRIPYSMEAQATVLFGQKGVTLRMAHNVDKPFEIHRLIPRPVAVDDTLSNRAYYEIAMTVLDVTRDQPFMPQPVQLGALVKGDQEKTWEWADPFYLEQSEAMQFTLDSLQTTFTPGGQAYVIELALVGYMIVRPRVANGWS